MRMFGIGSKTQLTLALTGLVWVLAPSSAPAQDEAPGWLNVRVIEVKPDKAAEWEELQKERNVAIKKAGAPGRRIWEVARGDIDVYHIVTPLANLAGNDEPPPDPLGEAGFAQWVSRVNRCVGRRQVLTLRNMPELSIPLSEGRRPNLAVLNLRTNAPAMGTSYFNYLKDDYIPALKKAKYDGVYVSRIFAGDSVRTWAVLTMVDKWAAFDEPSPLAKALGQETVQKLIGKGAAMIERSERILLSYRPDLSVQ